MTNANCKSACRHGRGRAAVAMLLLAGAASFAVPAKLRADADANPKGQPEAAKLVIAPGEVKLSEAQIQQLGIVVKPLVATTVQPQVAGWGILKPDPAATFMLRSPYAGVLHRAGGHWPVLGQTVASGETIAKLSLLLTPAARVTLRVQLTDEMAKAKASAAALEADAAALQRLKRLNRQDQTVSIATVQQAAVQVARDKADHAAAETALTFIEAAIGSKNVGGETPLALAAGGEVVKLYAQPGESVTPGQSICRVESFDTLLAAIVLTRMSAAVESGAAAWITVSGHRQPMPGKVLALAPHANAQTGLPVALVQVHPQGAVLRPGIKCTGLLQVAGKPLHGWLVPASAVLWHHGKRWIYIDKNGLFRRTVFIGRLQPGGDYFVTGADKKPGLVVTSGAVMLLSIEERGKIKPAG